MGHEISCVRVNLRVYHLSTSRTSIPQIFLCWEEVFHKFLICEQTIPQTSNTRHTIPQILCVERGNSTNSIWNASIPQIPPVQKVTLIIVHNFMGKYSMEIFYTGGKKPTPYPSLPMRNFLIHGIEAA